MSVKLSEKVGNTPYLLQDAKPMRDIFLKVLRKLVAGSRQH